MADDLTVRQPTSKALPGRPSIRLKGNLKAGVPTAVGTTLYEVIQTFGCAKLTVRIKTVGNGGQLVIQFVGPDFPHKQSVAAYGALVGTIYTTGNPASVPVVAGTEAIIQVSCDGANHAIVSFVPGVGPGTISYVDVSQVSA